VWDFYASQPRDISVTQSKFNICCTWQAQDIPVMQVRSNKLAYIATLHGHKAFESRRVHIYIAAPHGHEAFQSRRVMSHVPVATKLRLITQRWKQEMVHKTSNYCFVFFWIKAGISQFTVVAVIQSQCSTYPLSWQHMRQTRDVLPHPFGVLYYTMCCHGNKPSPHPNPWLCTGFCFSSATIFGSCCAMFSQNTRVSGDLPQVVE